MAIETLALLCALQTSVIAFTVFFSAQRFFARAFASWYIFRHSLKIPRLTIIYNAFGLSYFLLISCCVMATHTNATLITKLSLRKALAVQF